MICLVAPERRREITLKPTRRQFLKTSSATIATAGLMVGASKGATKTTLSSFDPQVKALLAQMTLDEKL